jgi:hypothetical protein
MTGAGKRSKVQSTGHDPNGSAKYTCFLQSPDSLAAEIALLNTHAPFPTRLAFEAEAAGAPR